MHQKQSFLTEFLELRMMSGGGGVGVGVGDSPPENQFQLWFKPKSNNVEQNLVEIVKTKKGIEKS